MQRINRTIPDGLRRRRQTWAAFAAMMIAMAACLPAARAEWTPGATPDVIAPILTLDATTLPATTQAADSGADLTSLSIEDLLNIQVTSVSKQKQRLGDAAAAVYVISPEDIRRSGMTSIAELLRLAPGMDVGQVSPGAWEVGSRGITKVRNSNLLVLMDGRTLYTPLFSGVYWDQVDYLLADLERIEVIRGPGATLWGSNAVNGVINITSKSAKDTQGALVNTYAGTDGYIESARFGGNIDNRVFYRIYGKYRTMDDFPDPADSRQYDGWDSQRGGFRIDAELTDKDLLTVQSDIFQNRVGTSYYYSQLTQPYSPEIPSIHDTEGQNVLARWTHTFSEDSDFSIQAYFDRLNWFETQNQMTQNTYDIELQHRFPLLGFNEIIWGAGYRMVADNTQAVPTTFEPVTFNPTSRDNSLTNGFIQDDITIIPKRLHVIAGTKLESNAYTDLEVQPSLRLLLTPNDKNTLWAGVSRAVRSPARWEEDFQGVANVQVPQGSPLPVASDIHGNRSLASEQLTALEGGYRVEPMQAVSLDIESYCNFYHGLIGTVNGTPSAVPSMPPYLLVPIHEANIGDGVTYGTEVSATWKVNSQWRLQGSYSFLQANIHADQATADNLIEWNSGTPKHQFQIHSYYDITKNIELNAALYFTDAVRADTTPIGTSVRADANMVWRPEKHTELTVGFRNLFDNQHPEYLETYRRITVSEVPRSFFVSLSVQF